MVIFHVCTAPRCSVCSASVTRKRTEQMAPYLLFKIENYFLPFVGMGPKNFNKVKLHSAHSFMFQFCFQVVCAGKERTSYFITILCGVDVGIQQGVQVHGNLVLLMPIPIMNWKMFRTSIVKGNGQNNDVSKKGIFWIEDVL